MAATALLISIDPHLGQLAFAVWLSSWLLTSVTSVWRRHWLDVERALDWCLSGLWFGLVGFFRFGILWPISFFLRPGWVAMAYYFPYYFPYFCFPTPVPSARQLRRASALRLRRLLRRQRLFLAGRTDLHSPQRLRDFFRIRRKHRRSRNRAYRLFCGASQFPTAIQQLPTTSFAFPAGGSTVQFTDNTAIPGQLDEKLRELASIPRGGARGLYLVHDSGATRNLLCGSSSALLPYLTNRRPSPPGSVIVGGGRHLPYKEEGEIMGITFTTVEDLHYDLYSAISAAKRGVSSIIDYDETSGKNQSFLYDKKNRVATPLIERSGMLEIPVHLFLQSDQPKASGLAAAESSSACTANDSTALVHDVLTKLAGHDVDFLIHRRLGHLPSRSIRALHKAGTKGVPNAGFTDHWCHTCHTAGHKREPAKKVSHRHPGSLPGQYLHSDLAMVSRPTLGGHRYVLTVVDEGADMYYVTLLKDKTCTLAGMREIAAEIRAATKRDVVQWTFDRGTEFLNKDVRSYVRDELQASTFYSNVEHPWENGLAERSFGVLFTIARALLHDAKCPDHLWGHAILHGCYLRNRRPSKKCDGKSPIHVATGAAADLSKLRVFGCPAMVYVRDKQRYPHRKLAHRSVLTIFVGMSKVGNGWLFLHSRDRTFYNIKLIDSKDVKFNELFEDMRMPLNVTRKNGTFYDADLVDIATNQKEFSPFPEHEDDVDNSLLPPLPVTQQAPLDNVNAFLDAMGIGIPSEPTGGHPVAPAPPTPAPKRGPGRPRKAPPDPVLPAPQRGPGRPRKLQHQDTMAELVAVQNRVLQRAPVFLRANITPTRGQIRQACTNRAASQARKRGTVLRYDPSNKGSYTSAKEIAGRSTALLSRAEEDSIESLADCVRYSAHAMAATGVPEHVAAPDASTFGGDPVSWRDILQMPDAESKRYKEATMKELNGLKLKCITTMPRSSIPKGEKLYNASVMWTTKFINGSYDKTKCRSCFAGHTFDKSHTDCYAPVAKFISVLIVLCLSAMHGWFLTGLDFEMAYLNADLDVPCYMRAPTCMKEYDDFGHELYWKCTSCIYGHPASGALWSNLLAKRFREHGFKQLLTDQCVFTIWKDNFTFTIVTVNVDDCILASNSQAYGDQIRAELLAMFPGKDLGRLDAFCGMQIKHTDTGLRVSLHHYLTKFFALFNILPLQPKTGTLPNPLSSRPTKADCPPDILPTIKAKYLKLTGMLIWVYTHCRLDLAFPIHAITRVMHNPCQKHLDIVIHLCRYVCTTQAWDLCFHYVPHLATAPLRSIDFVFYAFCDSSWADDPDAMCSTGGFFLFLQRGQGAISSKSFVGKNPALSSTEAEYVAAAESCKESLWVQQFLQELDIFKSVTFEMLEDSQPCINALKKNVSDSRFRHVRIYYHFIRDAIRNGWCAVVKIGTHLQTGDLATKLLPSKTVLFHSNTVLGNSTAT